MTTAIRVLLVDDHPVFRRGLNSLLVSLGTINVVGEAATARTRSRSPNTSNPMSW